MRVGGAEIVGQTVFFRNGAAWSDAEIVLSKAGQCNAVVRSGDTPVAAAVLLFPVDRALRRTDPRLFLRTWTGPDGSALLRGIVPGKYALCAITDADPTFLVDPTTLDRIEDHCKIIELAPNEARSELLTAWPPSGNAVR